MGSQILILISQEISANEVSFHHMPKFHSKPCRGAIGTEITKFFLAGPP